MGKLVPHIPDGDWVTLRRNLNKLASSKLGPDALPTFAGLTISGNSVFGLNSSVFQPTTDSTTFFQVLDADGGTPIFNIDTTNERVGFNINAPVSQIHLVSDDGDVKIGTDVFTNKTVTTDTGIELSATGRPKTGLFTEVNGSILSYAINVPQIGDRDTAKVGGIFRLDTRASTPDFTIFGYPTGGSVVNERFLVSLQTGETLLTPSGGNVIVGQITGNNSLTVQGANAIIAATGTTQAIYRWRDSGAASGSQSFDMRVDGGVLKFSSLNDTFTVFTVEGIFALAHNTGYMGIGELAPETLMEWTHTQPYLTLHNSTHEDTDSGRESRLNFKGEQSGGEETTLARIEVSHDGAADDQKGQIVLSTNDGNDGDTPTERVKIDSAGLVTFAGDINIPHDAATLSFQWTSTNSYSEIQFKEGSTFVGFIGAFGSAFGGVQQDNLILTSAINNNGGILFRTRTSETYATRAKIINNGNFGINTLTPDTKLQVVGDCKFGDDNTNYVGIGTTGDVIFTGGAGLSFGSFWGNEIGFVAAGGTGTYFEINDAGITVGQAHNTTFQNNKELAVTYAGMYLVNWSMSVKGTGAGKHIVGGIGVDVPGGANALVIQNDGRNHAVTLGNSEMALAGTAILDLAATSEVGLMATNETDGTNVTVEHVSISILLIGGT